MEYVTVEELRGQLADVKEKVAEELLAPAVGDLGLVRRSDGVARRVGEVQPVRVAIPDETVVGGPPQPPLGVRAAHQSGIST
ncbi:hypothetical protein amrb99_97950 [Actinomadura sp. RB99]|nr:hypothetical protein [Actinomadura sp. RB99]